MVWEWVLAPSGAVYQTNKVLIHAAIKGVSYISTSLQPAVPTLGIQKGCPFGWRLGGNYNPTIIKVSTIPHSYLTADGPDCFLHKPFLFYYFSLLHSLK